MEPETTEAAGSLGEVHVEDMSASVARGGLWSIFWQVAGLAAGLAATPFTIRLLGPAGYGTWALLQTALTWVALADLGMSWASTRVAGDSLAQADDEGEVEAVWTSVLITVLVTSVASGVAAWFAPQIVEQLLHVHGHLNGPATAGLRVMCAALVVTAVNGTFNTPQIIRLRWFVNTLTTNGNQVLQVILIPVALWLAGGSVLTAAIVAGGTSALGAVGTVLIAVRLQPRLRVPRVSTRTGRQLLRYGSAISVSGLATIVLTSAERLLLGHYATAAVVAFYVVAQRFGTLIASIPAAVAAPLFPALVRLSSSGANDRLRRLYAQALRGSFLLLTPVMLLLGGITHPFLSLWAGRIYGLHSTHLVFIVFAGIWFNSLAYMPTTYLLAAERASLVARIHTLELGPYVAAAALLTSRDGATGAAIVWSARSVIDALILFALATRTGRLTVSPLSSRWVASLGAPLGLAAAVLALSAHTTGFIERLLAMALLAIAYLAALWWLVLTRPERTGIGRLAVQLRPRAHLL